jgi:CopG-like RHH_1 or ribbon-helix-helix domain, RHH_5
MAGELSQHTPALPRPEIADVRWRTRTSIASSEHPGGARTNESRRQSSSNQLSDIYGIMYGVKRTTIYLPEDLKSSLARAAEEDGRTEADLIREGIERLLGSRHPEPRVPLFTSGKPGMAEKVDELLAGFGEA